MKKFYFLIALTVMGAAVSVAAPRKLAPRQAAPSVSTPVTLPATNVSSSGFTANWKATPGASLYQVTVYEPLTAPTADTYVVLEEGFNYVELGTFLEPFFPDESFINLADYDMVDTPDWQGWWPVFARGMVSGIIYSPYIDLTNDGGKFTVNLSVVGWAGAMVKLTATGSKTVTKELYLTQNGTNDFAVEFDCGTHDTYLTFVDYGIDDPEGQYADKWDFLNNIQVVQNLEAGDTFLRLIELYETPEDSGVTSHDFFNMKFLYGARDVAYDVMAISVVYNDPFDDWDYDVYYSDYSPLEHVHLDMAGVDAVEAVNPEAVEFFNLNGQPVKGALAPGLYIRRQGNEVSKVVIR